MPFFVAVDALPSLRIDEIPCIFPANREFRPFRDGFARDCLLQQRVNKLSVPLSISARRLRQTRPWSPARDHGKRKQLKNSCKWRPFTDRKPAGIGLRRGGKVRFGVGPSSPSTEPNWKGQSSVAAIGNSLTVSSSQIFCGQGPITL